MKKEARFVVLCTLLFVLVVLVNITCNIENENKIYVSKQELDSLAAADTIVIRACSGDATATERDILEGQTAWVNGKLVTGTIPVRDSTNDMNLNPGESYKILEGYYPKDIVITTTPLSELTPGDITADSLSSGQVAWVNGKRIVGTGKVNQDSYQQGYSETSNKGRAHLNQINTQMVIKLGDNSSKLQGTGAGMTVDVTGSNASNVILTYKTKAMMATSSYQSFKATLPDYSCQ